jgi:ankyrin repeat protein
LNAVNNLNMPKSNDQRTLDDVLQDIAHVLFPGDDSPRRIALTTTDNDGDTPLHVYLWRNDPHAVRVLLAHGASINAIGDMGETPLHVAVRKASPSTLAAILAAGAREDIVSEFEQTPLQLAQEIGREPEYREAKRIVRDLMPSAKTIVRPKRHG